MNDQFCSIPQYIECQVSLADKIRAYDLLIEGMETAYLEAITSGHLEEYQMDDGQMKVRAKYRNPQELNSALKGLEQLRQRYVNRLNGRVTVLRGGNL